MILGIFLSVFLLFLYTLAPSFSVGDAGEFCAASTTLGLAHSPGYPLFCLLGKLAVTVIPWGSFAFRVNILSALFGAGTVTVLYSILRRDQEGRSHSLSMPAPEGQNALFLAALAVLLLAITPAFWRSSIQTEVFTLNTLFAALILYAFQQRNDYLAFFLFGLGLGNHHTLVFMSPLLLYSVYRNRDYSLSRLLSIAGLFAAGFSVYLYLPIRTMKNPGLDWGNPENIHNLWRVISRADYGSLSLTTGPKIERSFGTSIEQIVRFVSILQHQYTLPGILLGIGGWYVGIKNRNSLNSFRSLASVTLFSWCLAGPGFLLLANLPFNAETEGILERFYILVNLFWVFPLLWGLEWLWRRHWLLKGIGVLACCGIIALTAARLPSLSWRQYYLAYDYGRNLLKTLPPNCALFMDGGDDTFYSLAYLCFAEKRRQDVELHDRGGLVFKNVYGPDFRQLPKDEKEKRRRTVEHLYYLRRPVYFSTFNKDVMPGIELAPDGILYRPGSPATSNALPLYSLRSVYNYYDDYRSRALVPVYPYFSFYSSGGDHAFWHYAYARWPEVLWLKANLRVELVNEAFKEFSAGRLTQADGLYSAINKLFPDEASAFVNRGVIAERRNEKERAQKLYLKAIEVSPKNPDAYYNLAVLYWQEGNWQEVVRRLNELLTVKPDDQRGRYYLPIAETKLRAALQGNR